MRHICGKLIKFRKKLSRKNVSRKADLGIIRIQFRLSEILFRKLVRRICSKDLFEMLFEDEILFKEFIRIKYAVNRRGSA